MKTLFDKIEKQTYVDRLELWKMGKLTPDGKYAAKPIFASALFRHLPTHHDYKILRPFCLFAFLFFCLFVFFRHLATHMITKFLGRRKKNGTIFGNMIKKC